MDVEHVNSSGFAEVRRVREGTPPSRYGQGVRIGPPDLSRIPLDREDLKLLQAALVKARLISPETLRGSSGVLYTIVKNTLPHKNTHEIVRWIKSIYQEIL